MNAISKIDMQEATRLTREGRLQEAMALLRGDRNASPSTTAQPGVNLDALASLRDSFPKMPAPQIAGVASGAWAGKLAALKNNPLTPTRSVTIPDGARFEARTHANVAGTRPYKVYVPSGFKGEALPVVVMLHGCTQSPDDFALGTRMNTLAEADTFIVVYPAQTQAANQSKCWNWFSARDQQRDSGEAAIIAGITREVMAEFGADAERVYVAGLSAGGAAAAIMGAAYPDLYAAIGVHSGLVCGAATDLPSALAAMRQGAPASRGVAVKAPAIVFHGDRDVTVNPINGEQVSATSGAEKAHATRVIHGEEGGVSYTQTIESNEAGTSIGEHWKLHGVGHAWSGGSSEGSYADPSGPDASREMVRFFLQHRLNAG
ncbi:MAG: esterase [Hyphomicrobiales bacterium]|nr:esterase [Hyphomicrobiales bacterium]